MVHAQPTYPGHNEDISPEQKPTHPKWSAVYNLEIERTLDLDLAHTFTYDAPVFSVKFSPDGQRLAVGLRGDGKTYGKIYLHELQTGSTAWLVAEPLIDPSFSVDPSVKDRIDIYSVQFSPDGQLLATGASDCQITVCFLKIKIVINLEAHTLLIRYGTSP